MSKQLHNVSHFLQQPICSHRAPPNTSEVFSPPPTHAHTHTHYASYYGSLAPVKKHKKKTVNTLPAPLLTRPLPPDSSRQLPQSQTDGHVVMIGQGQGQTNSKSYKLVDRWRQFYTHDHQLWLGFAHLVSLTFECAHLSFLISTPQSWVQSYKCFNSWIILITSHNVLLMFQTERGALENYKHISRKGVVFAVSQRNRWLDVLASCVCLSAFK